MNTLVSKIQYFNCEPGEFRDEQPRTLNEVIDIIEKFPWDQQRKDLRVSPTNPSVTIKASGFEFLKLAVYYNGKFVLYYFRNDNKLYYKSFLTREETFDYLKSFYDSRFNPADFKSESRWFQTYSIHFITRDFKYFVSGERIKSYLISTSGINFCLGIFVLILMLAPHRVVLPFSASLLLFAYIFLLGGGINLILFFNYYRYAKDKILIMSKGEEVFYFGNAEKPDRYEKKEITGIVVYEAHGTRNPVVLFKLAEIEFEKKANILIPNLLLNMDEFINKLSDYPITYKNIGFPSIKTKRIELAV